jgi:hypothetical protein
MMDDVVGIENRQKGEPRIIIKKSIKKISNIIFQQLSFVFVFFFSLSLIFCILH